MKEQLLQPFQLGNLTLPNRVVMTAIKLGYGSPEGKITEQHLAFYRRRAEGGVGLLTIEPLYVLPNGREIPTQLRIDKDDVIPRLQLLTAAIHAAGGLMMAHINHAGRAANLKLVSPSEIVSASDVLCPANQVTPNAMDHEQIHQVIEAFGAAARRTREAGFDAIEVPFSHGYLIHQFLSPYTNLREDVYGGSPGNRQRLGLEILRAVRENVGEEFPIVVRLNAKDYVEGGLELGDALAISKSIKEFGVQGLSVTSGTMCESVAYSLYPSGTPKANLLPMAAQIRAASGLPVVVAGRIRSPQIARDALTAEQTDLIGLARPLLADPDWVRKVAAKDEEAILLCASCHQGCLAQLRQGKGTHCMFNPLTGYESEIEITQADKPRSIMVVGGGPAGLQAAVTAAQRGHQVVLYEKQNRLGGQLTLAAKAPHKEELIGVIDHLSLMAQRAGVEIHKNISVNAEMVLAAQPDAIIIATGGIPLTISLAGLEETNWLLASDLLDGTVKISTKTAFVIGGGLVGLESADFLSGSGVQVTVVEMLPDVGVGMDILAKNMLLKRLQTQGVKLYTSTKITHFSKDIAFAIQEEQPIQFPIESVVIAVGVLANRKLAEELEDLDLETYLVGDALQPRKAYEAIREGFQAGLDV